MEIELLVQAYNDQQKAKEVLKELKRLERDEAIEILSAAVIRKDDAGQAHYEETEDVDAKRGGIFGAIVGGVLGIFGGPLGVVAGAIAGGAAGAASAQLMDFGFPNQALEEIQQNLTPDSSALIVLIDQSWLERVLHTLQETDGKLVQQHITTKDVAELERLLSKPQATDLIPPDNA